uniref:Secreted protein n=1 Tax=Anopheles darlingi TaxID=43151 RepID=A0A2M4DG55_ANODA
MYTLSPFWLLFWMQIARSATECSQVAWRSPTTYSINSLAKQTSCSRPRIAIVRKISLILLPFLRVCLFFLSFRAIRTYQIPRNLSTKKKLINSYLKDL